MSNMIESLSVLKSEIRKKNYFKDINIVYQGFGPLGADMFRHFTKIGAIISFFYGQEAEKYIEEGWGTPVFSYEKKKRVRHNNVGLFNDYFYYDAGEEILKTLNSLTGKVCFIPFQTTPELHKFLFEKGRNFHLFQNPVIVQNYFDYKARLAMRAEEIGIPMPPDSVVRLFGDLSYKELRERYQGSFVVQIPLSQAGGGTDFIHSEDDFNRLIEEKKKMFGTAFDKTQAKVTRYLAGPSLNSTGCVVSGEVVCSQPDVQIVGDPYIVSNPAQYIGSDFSVKIEEGHKREILDILKKIGKWMGRNGYRGNFGVDFLTTVDKKGKVDGIYVSEVNARLVGESQYMADFQASKNSVPLTFFHLAEYLDIDIDKKHIEEYNNTLPELEGSALIIYTKGKGTFKAAGNITAGVYRLEKKEKNGKPELVRLRDGYLLSDVKADDEFVLTNGLPWDDLVIGHPRYGDDNVCLAYIMTKESIVNPGNWRLVSDKWKNIADIVRDSFDLKPCHPRSLREDI